MCSRRLAESFSSGFFRKAAFFKPNNNFIINPAPYQAAEENAEATVACGDNDPRFGASLTYFKQGKQFLSVGQGRKWRL
jgi:hypothetical protein